MFTRRDVFSAISGASFGQPDRPIGSLQTLLDEKAGPGGAVYLPAGVTTYDGVVIVPPGVNLLGQGSGWYKRGSVLKAASPSAQLRFGARPERTPGGVSGNFVIDGAAADQPLYIGQTLGRTFLSLDVVGSRGDQLVIEDTQGALFVSVNLTRAGGSAMVLAGGASQNQFTKCDINFAGRYALEMRGRSASRIPKDNEFDHCIFERSVSGTAANLEDAKDITFDDCVFAIGPKEISRAAPVIRINRGERVRIRSSYVTGSGVLSTGLALGRGSTVTLSDQTTFNHLIRLHDVEPGASLLLGDYQASSVAQH